MRPVPGENRVRTGAAPQIMAALRNLTISLLRLAGETNIAPALRRHAGKSSQPTNHSPSSSHPFNNRKTLTALCYTLTIKTTAALRRVDRSPRLRKADRGAAGPAHPPRPHTGNERREPPPQAQPREHRAPSTGRPGRRLTRSTPQSAHIL